MINECNIIRDILPLYSEGMASEDTKEFVETHISGCSSCSEELKRLQEPIEKEEDYNITILHGMKKKMMRNKLETILLTISMTSIFILTLLGFLTTPSYISYRENLIQIEENNNVGQIILHFNDKVEEVYHMSFNREDGEEGQIYYIQVAQSIWHKTFSGNRTQIRLDAKIPTSIYYMQNNGREDILIYGPGVEGVQHQITLPRLFLNYYVLIAAVFFIVIGIVYLVMRIRHKHYLWVERVLLAPSSYLLAHILIMRGSGLTYQPLKDLTLIILTGIFIYLSLFVGSMLIRERVKRKY